MGHQKETIIRHDYEDEMQKLDAKILEVVNAVADEQNCSMVLLQNNVFRGGINITPQVIQNLNLQN